ncbi:hypothetical protein AM1_4034 [Acaryochloris marina MBIC11017]|uniref:Uncharacterized protein n=1 Tax=Acaryochloris marina (strain MBIC 11017) TaxID=329726 RepID=B0C9K4_ACAM1|nr:hypothetical protein AM1_4034 [Acaryochloris marina MBIC11017]
MQSLAFGSGNEKSIEQITSQNTEALTLLWCLAAISSGSLESIDEFL